jgi:hypothetical protein
MKQRLIEQNYWTFNGEKLANFIINSGNLWTKDYVCDSRREARSLRNHLKKNHQGDLGRPKKVRVTILIED